MKEVLPVYLAGLKIRTEKSNGGGASGHFSAQSSSGMSHRGRLVDQNGEKI